MILLINKDPLFCLEKCSYHLLAIEPHAKLQGQCDGWDEG